MTKDQVLLLLKQADDYISGEMMSKEIGVSRAAIHTAVNKLRKEGYQIVSVTNKGYRLENTVDQLTFGEITSFFTKQRKGQLICYESTDSTNDRLKELAQNGASAGTVVIANEQTAGKGRMGRVFQSDKNTGIYMSILMKPQGELEHISEITAWVAVCVSRAIEKVVGITPGIKWVNDVVLNGKKVCGILTELSVEGESGRIQHLIVGIGLNVHNKTEDFSEEIRQKATSIDEQSEIYVNRAQLAAAVIEELDLMFEKWPEGKEDYLSYYREHCVTTKKQVRLLSGKEERVGYAEEVTENFHLQVCYEDGKREAVSSGEVSVRGMYDYIDK